MQIGSNRASMNAQRHLGAATDGLRRSFERLSSGMRINRASDDAAGLAISSQLNASSRVARSAVRNMNDAISVTTIMSSAITEQISILTRMTELAEQSANGTFTYQQRRGLQAEYSALLDEYVRIGETTSYNGIALLGDQSGSTSSINFQAGINGDMQSVLRLATQSTATIGGVVGIFGDITGNGTISSGDTSRVLAFLFGTQPAELPELPTVESVPRLLKTTMMQQNVKDSNGTMREIYMALVPHAALAVGLNTQSEMAYLVADRDGNLTALSLHGSSILYGSTATKALTFSDGSTANVVADLRNISVRFTDTSGPLAAFPLVNRTSLRFSGVQSTSQARYALETLDYKRQELGQVLGAIGAVTSRFEVATSVLTVQQENFSAAESRIVDADIAAESAQLVRGNIKQQAAAAVLAQANQQPALAIQLLR